MIKPVMLVIRYFGPTSVSCSRNQRTSLIRGKIRLRRKSGEFSVAMPMVPSGYACGRKSSTVHNDGDRERSGARVQNRATVLESNSNMRVAKPTLVIRGDALALVIDGPVEGIIAHHEKHLTVGKQGRIKGQVHASSVTVVGQVIGDVRSDGVVSLANGAYVEGNIFGARVLIQDGARFNGQVGGEIHSDGTVSLAKGADVEGNICSARVVIEDGAKFKGNIDTGEPPSMTVSTETAQGESVRSGKTATVAA